MRAVAYGKITYPFHMHYLARKSQLSYNSWLFIYPIRIQFYGPAAKTKNPRHTEYGEITPASRSDASRRLNSSIMALISVVPFGISGMGAPGVMTAPAPVGPVGPAGPGIPCTPCGPVGPAGPGIPCTPCGPVGPMGPVLPCGPVGPVAPVAPVGPVLPAPWLAQQ